MRSKLVAAVVIVTVLVAGAIWWRWRRPAPVQPASTAATPAAGPQPAAPGRETLQQQLSLDIIRNGLTLDKAKRIFSMVFGDLPGMVTPPDARDPNQFCGTLAATYIYQFWNQLTPAEQAAVRKVIGPSKGSRSARGWPSSPFGDSPRPHLMLAGLMTGGGDPPPKFDYRQLAEDANKAIGDKLGLKEAQRVRFDLEVGFDTPKNGTAKAETYSFDDVSGQRIPSGCFIHVYDPMFGPFGKTDAASILTHEMWHCYQQDALGNRPDVLATRPWLIEGEADWVMASIVSASTAYAKDWFAYSTTPDREFSQRGQDGIGIYGHLADVAGNDQVVWDRLLLALQLGVGAKDMQAFTALTDGYRTDYYTSWGSSYFLESSQPKWTMVNPGTPPNARLPPTTVTVNDKDMKFLPWANAFEAETLQVESNADILAIRLEAGYGRVHDTGLKIDQQMLSGDFVVLCLKAGGCTCPDGSAGASLLTKVATAPISLGLEGGDSMAVAGAAASSLDDFCKEPDPPTPPPVIVGGAGGGGGGSGGDAPPPGHPDGPSWALDVHVLTLDGLRYDFQAIGEYTLVKSTVDDFAIQVRNVPALKSRSVSVSQATAMKLAGHRVTATLEDARIVLRIDGKAVTDEHVSLGGGSLTQSSTAFGAGVRVEWPDGTTARIDQAGSYTLNTTVTPSEQRRGTLVGLLGNDNGTPVDDLVAGGVTLATPPPADDIVHRLADAWRVTQEASLFDYAPGQTTASFTDPSFPDSLVDPTRVPDRATAEQRCRQSGVTNPALLDNCIVDYGMTSDFLFMNVYSRQQQILAAHAALPPPTPGILRTVMLKGTISDATPQASVQFTGRAGDVLWIGGPDCTDNYMQMSFDAPSGKKWGGGGAICARGRLVLPETGDYVLVSYRTGNPAGAYSIPLRIVRPDRVAATAYGQVVAGRIETRGAHDIYTFEGHTGDVLRVAGPGCEGSGMVVSIIDPDGHESLGPNCRAGNDYRITQRDGQFKLLINGGDGGFGAYHFVFQGVPGSGGQ